MVNKMKKMNMKNPNKKKKKKSKLKIIIFTIMIYSVFCYSFYYSMKDNKKIGNTEFINLLLSGKDYSFLTEYKAVNIVNTTMKKFLKIDFQSPTSILNNTIFKENTKDNTEIASSINLEYQDDYSNMEELKDVSSYITDPNSEKVENPLVYIYNSHQLENYSSENLDIYGITPNVLMASYILKEKLNNLGIPSIVEDANMSEMLTLNGWDYSYSYKASRLLVLASQSEYSSLKYFIDLHRDSVDKSVSTAEIDGKSYAKILFVVGQDHDNWEENLKTATEINNILKENYPDLTRGILKKTGYGVDGIYNQDLSSNSVLIELGSVDNTIEEVLNTINVLSNVLYQYIKGES